MRFTFPSASFTFYLSTMSYYEYYAQQAAQSGGGGDYFEGPMFQRGYGLGSTFRSIFNFIRPLFKPAVRYVGKQLLKSGANIASDVVAGRNLKESAKEHFTDAGNNIVDTAVSKMKKMQSGSGIKRKRKTKKTQSKRSRQPKRTPDTFDK